MASLLSSLRTSVLLLAAFSLALQYSAARLASASRIAPSGGLDGWQDPREEGMNDQTQSDPAGQAWTNPCGGFEGDKPWESGSTSHEACFGPGGELQFCCLSGSTGCSCPPWISSGFTDYGCYNYYHENTLNAYTGNECGYFLPASVPQRGATGRLLTIGNTTITGVISVTRADNGSVVGFVQSDYGVYSNGDVVYIGVSPPGLIPLLVSIPPGSDVSITRLNGPDADSTPPFLGFVGDGIVDLNSDDDPPHIAVLASTSFTPPNSTAQHVDSSFAPSQQPTNGESSVWSSQPGSNTLTATWTNSDKTPAPTNLCYYPPQNVLFISGNACSDVAPDAAFPVVFTAV